MMNVMKKISWMCLMTMMIILTACSKDDENSKADLVGKWYFDSYATNISWADDLQKGDWVEFKADGTYIEYYAQYKDSVQGKWKLSNNQLVIYGCDDNALNVTYQVKELSSKNLTLYFNWGGAVQTDIYFTR